MFRRKESKDPKKTPEPKKDTTTTSTSSAPPQKPQPTTTSSKTTGATTTVKTTAPSSSVKTSSPSTPSTKLVTGKTSSKSTSKPGTGTTTTLSKKTSSSMPTSTSTGSIVMTAPPPAKPIIVRIMTKDGVLRIEISPSKAVKDVINEISKRTQTPPDQISLRKQPTDQISISPELSLNKAGIQHGDLLIAHYQKTITAQTDINKILQAPESFEGHGQKEMILLDNDWGSDSSASELENKLPCTHPKTMKCPRCTKKDRYVELHRQCPNHPVWGSCTQCQAWRQSLMPRLKSQTKRKCKQFRISSAAGQAFSSFAITYGKQFKRIGFIFGRETEDKAVEAEWIYEPPQVSSEAGAGLLRSDEVELVERIAGCFGLKMLGWIFTHDWRDYVMSPYEEIQASKFQLKYGHRFTTLTMLVDEPPAEALEKAAVPKKDKDGKPIEVKPPTKGGMEAFQISMQLTRLVRRDIIKAEQDRPEVIQTTEPVLVEMRETGEVPIEFGLVTIPIVAFTSSFSSSFPVENRPIDPPTLPDLKSYLFNQKRKGFSFAESLRDLHLLIYLTQHFDKDVVFQIAQAAAIGSFAGCEGYEVMLRSLVGMD
ncbi:putative Nuclear protein localization protein 4 like protein [Blattamonas nauphoetae]|uniref:Nuclear protein localization protein 4 like protein n=1 Tax=Blattamonas nauphoetae TaxID=2049346 RepID=A0ABQ9YK57_9EUKA|nr:putative Nuclear protein localization protein 4 like protein [Blattamonas nauphoetae]